MEASHSHSEGSAGEIASVLGGTFVAQGVVVDDNPTGLYHEIEVYGNDNGFPLKLQQLSSAPDQRTVLERTAKADFTVVDHRLEGKFVGFEDGLEVARAMRLESQRQPLIYCSAYGEDFIRGAGAQKHFLGRASFLESDQHTFYFGKDELVPNGRLKEFVQFVYLQALHYFLVRLRESASDEAMLILNSRVVKRERREFRVVGQEGRGWACIRSVDSRSQESEEVVPVRLLRRAGLHLTGSSVVHEVVEFDSGVVMSYFRKSGLAATPTLSRRVLKILGGSSGD